MSDGSQQDKAPSAWKRFWLGLDEKGEVVVGEPIAEVGEASSEPRSVDEYPTRNVASPVTTGIVTPKMNFVDSVVSAAQRSFNWKGRASRPAYWWVVLAYLVIVYGPLLIGSFTVDESSEFSGMLSNAMLLVWVLCLPAVISVAIRRLHDSGRSGWWWWIVVIPFIGGLIFLVLMLLDGDKEANRYGLPPEGGISTPDG